MNRESHEGAQTVVEVSGVSKHYGRGSRAVRALDNISLDVRRGEFLVLLGPSGCGKTTLLRSIAGLIEPTAGRIELHDEVVFDSISGAWSPPEKRDIGMVFQQYALWPHMTVERNVAYPLRARGLRDELRNGRVQEVLDLVQCGQYLDRYPTELSGGQQQRISLARALAARPAVMLMDEPLSNLDALLRLDLRAELRRVHELLKFTAVYVTHDQVEALSLASRVVVMRAGKVEQVGTPEDVYRSPATEYVAEFLGARVRLEMVAEEGEAAVLAGQRVQGLGGQFAAGTRVSVRLRPTQLHLRAAAESHAADPQQLVWLRDGHVLAVLPGGESTEFLIDLGGTRVTAEAPATARAFEHGDRVEVGFDLARAHLYPACRDGGLRLNGTSDATRSVIR